MSLYLIWCIVNLWHKWNFCSARESENKVFQVLEVNEINRNLVQIKAFFFLMWKYYSQGTSGSFQQLGFIRKRKKKGYFFK